MDDRTRQTTSAALFLLLLFTLCLHQQPHTCTANTVASDPPSSSSSSTSSKPMPSHFHHNPLRRIILSIALGLVTGLAGVVLVALIFRSFHRYISRTPVLKGPVIFSPKIDPNTLQSALSTENQLLGSNPQGKYYRTVLDNGLIVAVKTLNPFSEDSSQHGKRLAQKELEQLASLRDRNLMSLRAYVREPHGDNTLSLVYDYMPCGSLEDAMNRVRENQLQLSWEFRLRIAVGVIKGLQCLHCFVPQILHRNLKPSNVMLDSQFEPRLADFALAKLIHPSSSSSSHYLAPEAFRDGRYTDKSDIYSFGMILGVLLSGREPNETFFIGEASSGGTLGQWLSHLQQAGDGREALDKTIVGEEGEEDEMLMALRIAVVCLSNSPAERPSSDELVHMLTQLHSF